MRIVKQLLLAAFALAAPSANAGMILSHFSVDTSSIQAVTGYLDFQFNYDPAAVFVNPAMVEIMNFSSNGMLDEAPPALLVQGNAAGALASTVTLDNYNYQTNEYSPGFTFGTSIYFDVRLTWTDSYNPPDADTSFFFSMLDSSGMGLLTSAADPYAAPQLAQLDLGWDLTGGDSGTGGGVVTGTDFSSGHEVQFDLETPGAVPEPATFGLSLAGVLAVVFWRRPRRSA